jgi:cruciform cutting endonuclease 1
MAARLSWLHSLKATELKRIALAIGANSGGTKPVLTERLTTSLLQPRLYSAPSPFPPRLLSIDMGIRNLAYCHLSLPIDWNEKSRVLPTVHSWSKVSITSRQHDEDTGKEIKETYSPSAYAVHAHTLITRLVLSHMAGWMHPPTDILIERQRFRSGGSSAVQEWTLRVNVFEAMLYAVLHTLKEQGKWKGNVWGVAPRKVVDYWIGDGNGQECGVKAVKKMSKSREGKEAKIALVEKWLRAGNVVKLESGPQELAVEFLRKRDGGKSARSKGSDGSEKEVLRKLDDVADCLLQGVAWIEWERTRRMLLEEGWEAMELTENRLLSRQDEKFGVSRSMVMDGVATGQQRRTR